MAAERATNPFDRRTKALDIYKQGNYVEAEELLRSLIAAGFEIAGTHCHRARVLLMTDRIDEARQEVARAWEHRAEAPAYVVPRILFFQLLFAMQEEANPSSIIGTLKSTLHAEDAQMEWTTQPLLEHFKPRFKPEAYALLEAIAAAINSRAAIAELDDFPLWREA